MHILLPPSETKRVGGCGRFHVAELGGSDAVREARAHVRHALDALCLDPESATKALKLGVKSRGEFEHNLALDDAPALPAIDRYTGVLFDALDPHSLDTVARHWLFSNVSVQSALFGLVGAGESLPAYRLSAGTRLPELGAPLKRVWRDAHADIDWSARGWVLDMRSKDYVDLAPLPTDAGLYLDVVQRGDDGAVRALNHFNKAAKGDLVRRLATSRAAIHGPDDLFAWAADEGLEIMPGESGGIVLITNLVAAGVKMPATAR